MKFVPKELEETADISRGGVTKRKFFRNLSGVILAFGLLYLILGLIAKLIAARIPESWEAKLFKNKIKYDKTNSKAFHKAQVIFDHLLQNPELRPLPYQLILLELSVPNAIAIPGGYVGVTSKLLEEITSEGGLAMVLGHELGHHQKRHGLERLGRQLLLVAVPSLLFGNSLNNFVTNTLQLAELRYSREQEREADEFGLKLVHKTLGHTQGCLDFFELVQKDYESGSKRWQALFATHPYTTTRIEHLRALQESLRNQGDVSH